jgi:hypothetical protein
MASPIEDHFAQSLASRGEEKTVIAGYHWFGDWGRDTMIALPGLTLPTGKYEVARSILRTFAKHVDQGMLPNRLQAGETPEYNTVDATLWFFEAARATSRTGAIRSLPATNFTPCLLRPTLGTLAGRKRDPLASTMYYRRIKTRLNGAGSIP